MPGYLERYRHLRPWERRVVAETLLLLPRIGLALRRRGLRALLNRIERLPTRKDLAAAGGSSSGPACVQRISQLTAAAARHGPVEGTCLTRSLALLWVLRRRGIVAELRLGVRQKANLESHAWVELEGKPLNDSSDVARRYQAFADLDTAAVPPAAASSTARRTADSPSNCRG